MKTTKKLFILTLALTLSAGFYSCKKKGCTDEAATNYDSKAKKDDGSCVYPDPIPEEKEVEVTANITTSTTWVKTKKYILKGFIFVTSGTTLTIEPGTIIVGDKASKGTLIIDRGAKLMAVGTASEPIVFTSNQPKGQRDYGDWGGIIICGKGPVNLPGGEGVVEGGTGATFGGGASPDVADNSGKLKYVRIEFSGIPFQPNQEINGLTMGGLGSGTELDYIQVSYCGDDSYEWFGGTVNAKHLISFRAWDDNFDGDNGWNGKVQFAVALTDPNVADQSGSNGFEQDNDASGTGATPITNSIFSNVSIFGPKQTSGTTINSQYKRAAHLRRNTKTCIYNSLLAGYPTGLLIDGSACETNSDNDELQFRNNIVSGCATPLAVASGSSWDISAWFNTPAYANSVEADNANLLVPNAWNLTNPNFIPSGGSPLLSGASFAASNLQSTFFEQVSYKGAFGSSNWTSSWTNWDPQNTEY
ncbi:MAG: T9SS C-terminal target domain-containing protein [Bacteroidetes bacterium]|nr:T9SS C-terminal target domain-containing protein [Bacteroidota bacterium]NOG94864.1 T9SS C-terminal target domain-containing protein [Bacteroidota bacterium]GIK69333.1 MAG: hypothetical protein BroJett020_06280 [Bacteroidota bacterium]CAG0962556.1 hypothetical protein FLAV_00779 [Flavobacteriales bacterium]